MPFGLPSTTFPKPVSVDLDAALKRAVADLPAVKQGQLAVTATTTGLEASLAYRPKAFLTLSAWGARMWHDGSWQAGARATLTWGDR